MRRREFLVGGAAAAGLALRPPYLPGEQKSAPATLTIAPETALVTVPEDFTGLSYESAQLAHPDFFSASNKELIAFVKLLGKQGVLRIGGNTSSYTVWAPNAAAAAAAAGGAAAAKTDPAAVAGKAAPISYVITAEAIDKLAAFLDAVGWKLIYGLNLENGSAETAADEAAYVAQKVSKALVAFQFGNEPDLYRHADESQTTWTFDEYLNKWRQFARAVRAKLPEAPLAGPDISSKAVWLTQFAAQEKSEIVLLTGHYYAAGPPTDPKLTADLLLLPQQRLVDELGVVQAAVKLAGKPYRMTEGNSCYGGGKEGVSNAFASALWCGDYMLQLAQTGYAGVNLHGGGNGYYTPIGGSIANGFYARPIYYGVMVAEQFAGGTMVQTTLDAGGVNATAYAAKQSDGMRVAIFNKAATPLRVRMNRPMKSNDTRLWRLSALGPDSRADVTLAGLEVKRGDPLWAPETEERLIPRKDMYTVDMPAYSGAVMILA